MRYNCKINVVLKKTKKTLDINAAFETKELISEDKIREILDSFVCKSFKEQRININKIEDYTAVVEVQHS